ncbi:LacI family DNA-binding transcriptional regulator [Microbacterium sp. ZW T5_56]|uniref:LacI family DNA-binding transcriptional regulator n=1 Tax=Microbacterium sp. ZW T5_56 TaxID=3378081 RepID=UPI00385412ED
MAAAKRVTITDIARIARVSPGAVSFALNGKPGVSEETRERILQVAREQQWQPSHVARSLVGARANAVGLALNRPARSLGTEAFFTDLIAGIQSGLSDARIGLHLQLVSSLEEELEIHRQWHASRQVDGVLVIDPLGDDPRIDALRELQMPTILVGSHVAVPSALWVDDTETASTLFGHLRGLGHSHIAYVAGPAVLQHTRLRARVLGGQVIHTDFSPGMAAEQTRRLLNGDDRPTAIVYDNDVMAVAGLRAVQEMGVGVPADVSLASFDDSVIAGLVRPSITAMTRDTFELGDRSARLLVRQIASDVVLPGEAGPAPVLTVRESTGRPGTVSG